MSVCLDIGCGTLCRSGSCMLRCWLWDAVPIWFLYASVLVVDEGRVLTCVCMLGYWMWDAVPIWFLYASVLDAGCCADLFFGGYGRLLYWLWIVLRPFSVCFGVGCGTLCRSGSCILRCWTWNVVPIYFYILCFLGTGQNVHSLLLSALCG